MLTNSQFPTVQEILLRRQQELEVREQDLRERAALQRQQELEQDLREQAVIQRQKELEQQLQHAAHSCQEEIEQAEREKGVREQEGLEQQELWERQESGQQAQGRHAGEQHKRAGAAARGRQAQEDAALKQQQELEQREAGLQQRDAAQKRQQELLQEALKKKAERVTKWLEGIPLTFPFSQNDLDAVKELMEVEVSQIAARLVPRVNPYVCHLCPPGCKTGSIREFIGHMRDAHNLLLTEQDSKTNFSPFRCPGCEGKWLSRDSLLKHYKKEEACDNVSRMRD